MTFSRCEKIALKPIDIVLIMCYYSPNGWRTKPKNIILHPKEITIMTQKQATRKSEMTVQLIARISFKADPRKVCYLVRSSDGQSQYITCLFDGKACSCDCAAKGRCYHMVQLEEREASRQAASQAEQVAAVEEVKAEAK